MTKESTMADEQEKSAALRRSGCAGLVFLVLWWLLGPLRGRGDDESSHDADANQPECQRIPADVYRRPDPMIYSQPYLTSLGLAVTWDNPDIHLEQNGVAIPSSDL